MISIIIPTYNRSADLERCLKSLKRNSFFENEYIILSPLQDHTTKEICNKNEAELYYDGSRMKGVRSKSLWSIINYGIELSKHKYVCWLNDDCIVLKNWDKYVMQYFNDEVGLVVLKTMGIGGSKEFRTIPTLFNIDCANYGVLDKTIGIRFDERFNWFYGDADIPVQVKLFARKEVVSTKENCIIHNHILDGNRLENETDDRAKIDEKLFHEKWVNYIQIGNSYFNMRNKIIKSYIVRILKIVDYIKA